MRYHSKNEYFIVLRDTINIEPCSVEPGMETIEDAPPIHLGGCEIYSARSPWVKRGTGEGWKIERLMTNPSRG